MRIKYWNSGVGCCEKAEIDSDRGRWTQNHFQGFYYKHLFSKRYK